MTSPIPFRPTAPRVDKTGGSALRKEPWPPRPAKERAVVSAIARIRFATYLGALAGEIRKPRSGERTRLKLLAAAALLLEDVGYRDLNVEEISAAAGLAKGTFYIYFDTKDEFLRELARQYVAFEAQFMPTSNRGESAFAATVRWIDWYEGTFASNVGVLRCMVQMGEIDPGMRALWHQRNTLIAGSTVDFMLRGYGDDVVNKDHVLFTVRTVGAMLDQSLFNRFQVLTGTGQEEPFDDEMLTRLHAVLIFRALYGCDPPAEEAADVLAILPSMKVRK